MIHFMAHIPHPVKRALHRMHTPVHCLYFGLVAVEAGKWYGLAAGALLIITLADLLYAEA